MRTQGTKIASDGFKGHVFEVSLAGLQKDAVACRQIQANYYGCSGQKLPD